MTTKIEFETYSKSQFSSHKGANGNPKLETRKFSVPFSWAENWIMANHGVSVDEFRDSYTYDDSLRMLELAESEGLVR